MARYQYQPLTGPVWTAAVAASLAWLPSGNPQPARSLPPNRVDGTVLPPFQPPAGFDPAQFPWGSVITPPLAERRVPGDSIEPFTPALYRPEGLQWQPSDWSKPQRGLLRGIPTWSLLDPFPLTVAFDPQQFPWTEARAPRAPIERRLLGDSVEPFYAALYRPDGLQWTPAGLARGLRGLVPNVPTWILLDPLPRPPVFDPALVPVIQTVRWQDLARMLRGELVEPFPAALYRPEGLQWSPSGRQPWRGLVPNWLGAIVGSPVPIVFIALPLQVEDRSDFRYRLLDQSVRRYFVSEQSGIRVVTEEQSKAAKEAADQSLPKLDVEDTA